MTQRELNLKKISQAFAIWEVYLSNNNSLNLYDGNIIFEDIVADLLNATFDYNLKNLNGKKKNHAAIDLADIGNRIAFQVTTTRSLQKVQETINSFIKNKLNEDYDELFIFILGKKQKRYKSIDVTEISLTKIKTS